jgi:penicillin amidase
MEESHEGMAFGGLEKARNVNEAMTALENFLQPPQNFVLADKEGNIAINTCGLAAIHYKNRQGLPYPQVCEFRPMNKYLRSVNPGKGFVASANQDHLYGPENKVLSFDFENSARGKRITEFLSQNINIDAEKMKELHYDVVDVEWKVLRNKVLQVAEPKIFEILTAWNGSNDKEQIAPTIYNEFIAELKKIGTQKMGFPEEYPPMQEVFVNRLVEFDEVPSKNGMLNTNDIIKEALSSAIQNISKEFGANTKNWVYGNYHKTHITHLANIEALNYPDFASSGNNNTVNVAKGRMSTHGASMRTIIEMTAKGPKAKTMLVGGQNGRPGHRNYQDQLPLSKNRVYHDVILFPSFEKLNYVSTVQFSR